MKADVLAIGAHPDDIELALGGTIAKLVKQGYRVAIAELTMGEMGTRGTAEIRAREAEAAARILGVVERRNLNIPDSNLELSRANIEKLIVLLREMRPEILFIPHSAERHPDHVHAHHLAKEAWFYAGLQKWPTVLDGAPQQPHRPANYFHFMQRAEFTPSFVIDVTDTYDIKMASIRAHASQFFRPESKDPETVLSKPSFLEYIETRTKYYGELIGVRYGEPFYSPLMLGISNPFDLILSKG